MTRSTEAEPGTRRSATSGAPSLPASRRPRRSTRAAGCCNAETSPTTTSTLPSAPPFHGGSVLALSWLPSGKLYALVHGTYWHLYVTLDSARTWYPRPALELPTRRARSRQPAPRAPPTSSTRQRAARPVALRRRRHQLVAPPGRRERAVGRDVAGALAARRGRAARAVVVGRLRRDLAQERPARHDRRLGSAQRSRLVRGPPDGELLVSIDGGRSWYVLVLAPQGHGRQPVRDAAGRAAGAIEHTWRVSPLSTRRAPSSTR